eukprot:6066070-Prymnesium_polylepis.1
MEEDDVDAVQAELRAADDWVDSMEGVSREEFDEKLRELQETTVGPVLQKYGEGAVMSAEDEEYSASEHEEL